MAGYAAAATASLDRDALVRAHAPLVKKVAYRIVGRLPDSVDVEDLIGAGMVGLITAVDRYDPSRGPFDAFAEWRIKGAILDELRTYDHLTRTQRQKASAVEKMRRQLQQELGRDATIEEIAEAGAFELTDVTEALEAAEGPIFISLDDLGIDREDVQDILGSLERGGPPTPLQLAILSETKRRLVEVLGSLKPREQTVLSLYYVEDLNYREIGEIMDLTESRICQIVRAALDKLARKMRD